MDIGDYAFFEKCLDDFRSICRSIPVPQKTIEHCLGAFGPKLITRGIFDDLAHFASYWPNGCRVLDWGGGSGFLGWYLARCGLHVTTVDIADEETPQIGSPKPLEDASVLKKSLYKALEAREANFNGRFYQDRIPFADGEFDAVLAYAVLEHVAGRYRVDALQELRRVLRLEGYLCISRTPNTYSWAEWVVRTIDNVCTRQCGHHLKLFRFREIEDWLNLFGFKIVEHSYTDFPNAFPAEITNKIYPFLRVAEYIGPHIPLLKHLSHHHRLIAQKEDWATTEAK